VTFRLLISNDGPSDNDYLSSIVHRAVEPKLSPWSNYKSAVNHVDFDQNFDPINPSTDSGGGRYTAQDGDTLQTVAAAVWGDAAMWYLLAEANGMTGDTQLAAGMSLIIPAKVANVHNNADTFKPYDPNKAIGDVSPTEMKPPERPKQPCGMLGMILLVVIAVAVSVVTAGAALAAMSPAITSIGAGIGAMAAGSAGIGASIVAGAIGGAMGSIVSQGFGVATGLQDQFSWKGVAMAAIAGGVGGGMGASGLGKGMNAFVGGALRGAASNAITQGIGVVTKLQNRFDWVGVAAGAAVGGVSAAVGKVVGGGARFDGGKLVEAASFGNMVSSAAAGALAGAAVRSALTGTSFGDNIMAVLPDAIGATIGNMISNGLSARAEAKPVVMAPSPVAGEGTTARIAREGVPRHTQEEIFNAEGRQIEKQIGGNSSWSSEPQGKQPTQGPRYATGQNWSDFDGSGGLSWGDLTGGLSAALYNTMGIDIAQPSGQAPPPADHGEIVVTGTRHVRNFMDILGNYNPVHWFAEMASFVGLNEVAGRLHDTGRRVGDVIRRPGHMLHNAARWGQEITTDLTGRAMRNGIAGALGAPVHPDAPNVGNVLSQVGGHMRAGASYLGNVASGQANPVADTGSVVRGLGRGITSAVQAMDGGNISGPASVSSNLAAPTPPTVFRNLAPDDIPGYAKTWSSEQLRSLTGKGAYVVMEDGRLITGRNNAQQGHIDLARGNPVIAAGEFKVVSGELKFIDNRSGHYQPSGLSAQMAAENAFSSLGFDVEGKYVERKSW
jgi:hypothetical protein